jgi:hypothetical protein
MTKPASPALFDRVSLVAVTLVAAFLRIPGIEARGRFDADQGHDMATLVAFTRDGVVPLLGPKTSVGEFHHGAFYYYLLAPSAWISNGDPVAVTLFIALLGIGAVALTWWLGRALGGPVAGLVAGMLLAVSPAAIEESTFIWNPNPIAFFAALALAAAWQGHASGRARWWAVAIGSAGVVTQLHVLGMVFLVAMLGVAVLELRRQRSAGLGLLGGLAIVVVLFAPLAAHELQTGFAETRGMLLYLAGSGGTTTDPVGALAFTMVRVVGWPLVGVVTDVPMLAAILLAVTVGAAVLGLRVVRGDGATGLRWLLGILTFSTIALALAAPSLQTVVAGLPNDHYHAFLDPIVVLLIAVPAGVLFSRAATEWRASRRPAMLAAAAALGVGIVALELVALQRKPPQVDPDGGWPTAKAAGERIVQIVQSAEMRLVGLPDFKLPDALQFPIERAGGTVHSLAEAPGYPAFRIPVVVVCDRLFEGPIGRPCGGPAEDALMAQLIEADLGGTAPTQVDRFDASPRTSVSIYR